MLLRALVIACLLATTARADQWVTPSGRALTSPNGKYHANVTPAADGTSGAIAVVGDKVSPRRIQLQSKWMPVDMVLLDDGSLLTLDEWHNLGYGEVATLYTRDGKIKWSKTLADIAGQAFVDAAPHSVSSIWWRATPLEWTLSKDGKRGVITLYDENQLEIELATGTGKHVAVANLPDDAQRLVRRGRALATQAGREAEAATLLERAIVKEPDMLDAVALYAETLQKINEHARALAGLDQMSKRWTVKDGTNLANVYVAWSKSYVALAKPAEVEGVLKLAVAAAPTYPYAVLAYSHWLLDQKRRKESDTVLDDVVARLVKAPSLDHYTLVDIAEEFHRRNDRVKALAIYLRGYKKDQVTNQFLYLNLAKLYEEMNDKRRSIEIHQQLLAYFVQMGSAFDSYAKTERDELVRLRTNP